MHEEIKVFIHLSIWYVSDTMEGSFIETDFQGSVRHWSLAMGTLKMIFVQSQL